MAIHLEYSTTAKCRPEHVWEKFKTIEQWPWWNPTIAAAKWVSGKPWEKGSRFSMELARPMRFKVISVVFESDAPNKVGWVGKKAGFTGEHWFSFEAQPDGSTLLKTWEDISGLVTIFFSSARKAALLNLHKTWIESLKFEAERIARDQFARS
jgi:hypothetical protein